MRYYASSAPKGCAQPAPRGWPTGGNNRPTTEPARPFGGWEFPGRNGQKTQKHLSRDHPAGLRDTALLELQAWTAMRFRRVTAVIASKNQLLGQIESRRVGSVTPVRQPQSCLWRELHTGAGRRSSVTRWREVLPRCLVSRSTYICQR